MRVRIYTKNAKLRRNPEKLARVIRKIADEEWARGNKDLSERLHQIARRYEKHDSSGGRRSSTSESAPRGDTGANPVAARPKEDDA